MADYLDSNDEAVAGLIAAYDALVARAESYEQSIEEQFEAANRDGKVKHARHVGTGRRNVRLLLDLLEEDVLEAVMRLKDNQHHIRMSREGKLV